MPKISTFYEFFRKETPQNLLCFFVSGKLGFPRTSKHFGSVAERVKASFFDDSDLMIISSTRTLVTLLRPWIRRFTIIISAWWLRTSSKFMWEEVKRQPESLENGQLLSGCGFVQSIAHSRFLVIGG